MVKASHGPRRGTRRKLRKSFRTRGKVSIAKQLQKFKAGDKVVIKPEPAVHKGMPGKRFCGRIGTVLSKRGKAYVLSVKDGGAVKQVISLPVHLRRA